MLYFELHRTPDGLHTSFQDNIDRLISIDEIYNMDCIVVFTFSHTRKLKSNNKWIIETKSYRPKFWPLPVDMKKRHNGRTRFFAAIFWEGHEILIVRAQTYASEVRRI